MTVQRVSTYALHQSTLGNSLNVQSSLINAQQQISSGLKAQNFVDLAGGQVEQFTSLNQKFSKTAEYLKNNQLAQSRVNLANTALDQVIETANNMKNLLLQRRNATLAGSIGFPQQVDGFYKTIAGQLNTQFEGRYIFSGTRSDQRPVDENTLPTTVEFGVPDTGYYMGSYEDTRMRVDDGFEITPNIRADDPAIQKLMAGIAAAVTGDREEDDNKLASAYDLLNEGIQDLVNVQAKNNANNVLLTQSQTRQEALQVYWKGLREDTINADVVSLTTQVAIDQGVLQATYQVFARINSLQLSDFLR